DFAVDRSGGTRPAALCECGGRRQAHGDDGNDEVKRSTRHQTLLCAKWISRVFATVASRSEAGNRGTTAIWIHFQTVAARFNFPRDSSRMSDRDDVRGWGVNAEGGSRGCANDKRRER